jgi:hypothetical protein
MATVMVDELRCKESSDSSDDIYMMIFRGNTTSPYDSNVGVIGPGNFWDDLDAGEVRKRDIEIAKYRPDAVYVVQLIERDSGRDIDATALGLWRMWADVAWKAAMASQAFAGLPTGGEAQRQAGAHAVAQSFLGSASATIRAPYDPDDLIDAPKRLVVAPGEPSWLEFKEKDGDGHYKILFKVG